MQKTQVGSLGQEDPLEKRMATLSSTLAWRIPWTEEPGGLQSMGSHSVRHDWVANTFIFTFTLLLVHDFKLKAELEFKTEKQNDFIQKRTKEAKPQNRKDQSLFFFQNSEIEPDQRWMVWRKQTSLSWSGILPDPRRKRQDWQQLAYAQKGRSIALWQMCRILYHHFYLGTKTILMKS